MRKKLLVTLVSLFLTLSMLLGILVSGSGGAATPKATVPRATSDAQPPARAGEVYNWRFQSSGTADSFNWWLQKELMERIKIASGGRLVIELLPAGAVIGADGVLDAISKGTIEAGSTADPAMGEKNELLYLTGAAIPATMRPQVLLSWYFYTTAAEQSAPKNYGRWWATQIYEKYFNIYWIPMTLSVTEVGYLSPKALLKATDYKGLKFGGTGYTLKVAAEMGATPVSVTAKDAYGALQTGVVDALEAGNLAENEALKLNDVAQYIGFPGVHSLARMEGFGVNMDVWKKLPPDLQIIVEIALTSFTIRNYGYNHVESARTLDKIIARGKPTVVYMPVEMQELWWKTSVRLVDAQAAASQFPEFKPMWEDMKKFQYSLDRYIDLQTPLPGPGYPGQMSKIPGILGLTK